MFILNLLYLFKLFQSFEKHKALYVLNYFKDICISVYTDSDHVSGPFSYSDRDYLNMLNMIHWKMNLSQDIQMPTPLTKSL